MAFENYEDIRAADVIEIFTREEVERSLKPERNRPPNNAVAVALSGT